MTEVDKNESFFNKINYHFVKKELFITAITHPSVNYGKKNNNYQRLEFLGDRILSFVLGEMLYKKFRNDNEGELSKKYAFLASREVCKDIAIKIGLNEVLILSKGEDVSNGRFNKSNLANTLESLIGAIFLDSGIEAARKFIITQWHLECDKLKKNKYIDDHKNVLQEISQAQWKVLPMYIVIDDFGVDNQKTFEVKVQIDGCEQVGYGYGSSKKMAEKNAAQDLIAKL